MEKIRSFQADHRRLQKGIYLSRIDGDVVTYDLRFCKPNAGEYLDNETMHTVEHMIATFARNSEIKGEVVYFGPMGCQTGFYLLVRDSVTAENVLRVLKDALRKTLEHEDAVFGASEAECGNYRTLCLDKAKEACGEYLDVIKDLTDVSEYEIM